ncbi:MAG: M20 family metallopeptidase [Gammaproteobacteria bacterium]|nr:MAG: M20 family peptidase [Gammaproteobacteria bacterium]UCH41358.1 MAG: M20 family metallopeptidase [Gammaproteobacteria bacterium]
MEDRKQVLAHLRSQQDSMTALLKDLVLMETPSTDAESQAQIRARLKAEFEQIDYRVNLIPGRNSGGHVYASAKYRGKRQPAQLMLGHCDTVWPIGTLMDMPLVLQENILHGPGVYDMKAGLVEMIYALRAIEELGMRPTVAPLCFINSDEEIGSRESTRYVRALAQRVDRCMVLEPSLGPSGKIKTARKGVGRFEVTVQGKAAHAGLDPGAGASAILELSHVIQKLFELNDPEHGTSVNVGVIDGGIRPNMVAPQSRAIIDVRVQTHADAERVENAIHGLEAETPGVILTIEGSIGRPPMERTESNQQLWRVAQELAEDLDLEIEQGTAGGGSDGNTTSLYTATLDGMGAVGDGAHAHHEHIDIDLLPERCALLTLLLLAPPLQNN